MRFGEPFGKSFRNKNDSPQKEADAWNAVVKVGDTVEYIDHPGAPAQQFTTASAAEVLSGHTAVVWLNGKSGCVCVSHCKRVAA